MAHTCMITGASRGIGAAIATRFAAAGYNLILCCKNSFAHLEERKEQLHNQYGVEVLCFQGDVAEYAFVEEMVEEGLKHFGQIDVLVNNAGIAHVGLLTDMSIAEWNHIVATNLTSVFATAKLVAPSMVARQKGKILNISSVWGSVGASCEVAYSACKGGMNAFTRALGKELAPSNVQVNAIACGCIDTAMNNCFSEEEKAILAQEIPAGRFGTPEEVAELAFSICNNNTYLTGQIITLDGGWI